MRSKRRDRGIDINHKTDSQLLSKSKSRRFKRSRPSEMYKSTRIYQSRSSKALVRTSAASSFFWYCTFLQRFTNIKGQPSKRYKSFRFIILSGDRKNRFSGNATWHHDFIISSSKSSIQKKYRSSLQFQFPIMSSSN